MSIEPMAPKAVQALRVELGPFARRLLEEALLTAMPAGWLRRAADFEDARPRPGDFNGAATPAELAARDRRCAEAAQACRERAEMLGRFGGVFDAEVAAAVDEAVAA